MSELILNYTPVRTSNNFLINNIKLDNIEIPTQIKKFENVEINKQKSTIDEKVSTEKLVYGLGEDLEKQVLENANSKINIEVLEKDDIQIIYDFDDNNTDLVNKIDILAKADCNITIKYTSKTQKRCFHNGIIKVIADENAVVNIAIINLLNEQSDNFEAIENISNSNSNIKYTIIDIGGKNSISNYYSNIVGDNANNVLNTIYMGAKDELKDINYIADVRGKKSNIDIDVQGALDENCKKNFKGTIDFKKGCTKSKGNENEYCILLSEKAKSIALPMLLCTEDDVEGNHSTASGKVDNKELFYIMTRGISRREAIKLMVKAKFNNILKNIKNEELKAEIIEVIDERLA